MKTSEPTQRFLTPPWPVIDEEGQRAVANTLASGRINYWTGEQTKLFEVEFAAYIGAPYALAVANGTLALELALRAAGISEGDEVIVPSRTFIATAGAVAALGATPVVADIDPCTNNVSALSVAEVLTPRTKAIIPVHLGGYPAPIDEIVALADQIGAVVIEDCAQAHGATYKGSSVGSLGAMGCFSFCQDKIMPLGEGGMITFMNEEHYERAWAYRDHGRSRERMREAALDPSPAFKWLTDTFGSNARMGEMEGALGRVMLRRLELFHETRTDNALTLARYLEEMPGVMPLLPNDAERAHGVNHAFYRLYARLNIAALRSGWTRDRVIEELVALGVPVSYGSCALIAHERAFAQFANAQLSEWRGATIAHNESLAFLVHPTLTTDDMTKIAQLVASVLERAIDPSRDNRSRAEACR